MTDGEKMVWAAAFALSFQEVYDQDLHPRMCLGEDEGAAWNSFYRNSVAQAAERASNAVLCMREHEESIKEGFEGMDVWALFKEMTL